MRGHHVETQPREPPRLGVLGWSSAPHERVLRRLAEAAGQQRAQRVTGVREGRHEPRQNLKASANYVSIWRRCASRVDSNQKAPPVRPCRAARTWPTMIKVLHDAEKKPPRRPASPVPHGQTTSSARPTARAPSPTWSRRQSDVAPSTRRRSARPSPPPATDVGLRPQQRGEDGKSERARTLHASSSAQRARIAVCAPAAPVCRRCAAGCGTNAAKLQKHAAAISAYPVGRGLGEYMPELAAAGRRRLVRMRRSPRRRSHTRERASADAQVAASGCDQASLEALPSDRCDAMVRRVSRVDDAARVRR